MGARTVLRMRGVLPRADAPIAALLAELRVTVFPTGAQLAWSKCPHGSGPSSAPAPPQGAPGGSGRLATLTRERPGQWPPSHRLGLLELAAPKVTDSIAYGYGPSPGFAPQLRGCIFLTSSANQGECLRRGIFGLPHGQAGLLRQIDAARDRTLLFLFNFQRRQLLGAFIASGPAGFPLEASAWNPVGTRRLGGAPTHCPGLWGGTVQALGCGVHSGQAAAPLRAQWEAAVRP